MGIITLFPSYCDLAAICYFTFRHKINPQDKLAFHLQPSSGNIIYFQLIHATFFVEVEFIIVATFPTKLPTSWQLSVLILMQHFMSGHAGTNFGISTPYNILQLGVACYCERRKNPSTCMQQISRSCYRILDMNCISINLQLATLHTLVHNNSRHDSCFLASILNVMYNKQANMVSRKLKKPTSNLAFAIVYHTWTVVVFGN